MKTTAFVMALLITTFGAIGIVMPSGLVWIARHSLTTGAFLVAAVVRVALGLMLIRVASATRAPKAIRVVGSLILFSGIVTALTALVAMDRARTVIEWWEQLGDGIFRLTGVCVAAVGGFLAWACAPARPAA